MPLEQQPIVLPPPPKDDRYLQATNNVAFNKLSNSLGTIAWLKTVFGENHKKFLP